MAKVILEFDPYEDADELQSAMNGSKYKIVLWTIDQELRSRTKYADDDTPEEVIDALTQVRDLLHSELLSYSLSLD